ncbi:hypothetical protein A6U97_27865 [Agrobacterium tumefaciens]|uniref:class I SAM-dependent methyltransferase n=1 Tax=Agrobacterium tumefaciens TaxID=358 RepID=UPI00080FDACB|nr:hypothetical protein A6U97_27865 [Agrobacterium tumefaciens]
MPLLQLDSVSLSFFSHKGVEIGGAHTGNANGVKVRRIIQLISDFVSPQKENVRILDVACGDGVYAIEAALHGFDTVAFDARSTRLAGGEQCAERNNISNIQFLKKDLRSLHDIEGRFDAILLLGILYHLTAEDVVKLLRDCVEKSNIVIIDTHHSLGPDETFISNEEVYHGTSFREHEPGDDEQVRYNRVGASFGNSVSFQYTKESLVRLLLGTGFTTVVECLAPLEPGKPIDRVTLMAKKSEPVKLATYPWINGKNELEIDRAVKAWSEVQR